MFEQLLSHSADETSVSWAHLGPLILTGAAFLLGMGLLNRERARSGSTPEDGLSHALRWAVIGLLFGAAIVHVPVIPAHLDEAPYMGVLFIAFTLVAFGVATALAARPSRRWYVLASALCGAAVLTYVATRLVAFPQLADDVGLWAEPLGLVALSTEAVVVLFSTVALRRESIGAHAHTLTAAER